MINVVVPTLGDRPDWLQLTVKSILAQDGVDVRLLVVGPEATQGAEMCHRLGVQYENFPGGLSAAINHGFRLTEGQSEFCTWIGDDDLLAPGSLEATSRALSVASRASYAYGHLRYIGPDGETLWYFRPGPMAAQYLAWGKNFVPQPGSLLKRSAVNRIGYLNESLKNSMDQDLFTRLKSVGPSVYVRKELAAYRIHDRTITSTKQARDESEEVRLHHTNRPYIYRPMRTVTQRIDRIYYGVQRRLPPPPAPVLPGGEAYHLS